MQRYLTKSRYKLGLECPIKLFYTNKKDEYADIKLDDPFLMALADGGFLIILIDEKIKSLYFKLNFSKNRNNIKNKRRIHDLFI